MKTIRFDRAKAETQANKAMAVITKAGGISSVGTNRNYKACLTAFCQYIKDNKLGDLKGSTKEIANAYLNSRSGELSQKSLDMHRQSIQCYFAAKGEMAKGEKLEIVKSQQETVLGHRAYTEAQVERVMSGQNERNAFSTQLAYACGLRAHELFTIRPASEQPPTDRSDKNHLDTKWSGRTGESYTVVGKGGLIREIRVPQELAKQLETHRLSEPITVKDRNVIYHPHYDLAGGKAWSNSFSKASLRVLNWSTGAHGLRHSYAQERMVELRQHCTFTKALETVSQEMGHFREDITKVYLR